MHLGTDAACDDLASFGGQQKGAAARLRLEAELQVLDVDLKLHAHHAA